MTDQTHYEPPSLRAVLAAGVNPVDALASNGWGHGAAEHLVDLLAMLPGHDAPERRDQLRASVAWTLEHQETAIPRSDENAWVRDLVEQAPAGALERLAIGELWTAELLEDRSLIDAVLAAAAFEVRASYEALVTAMELPNADGVDCWDDLTVEERRRVETFALALMAVRGN